MRTVVRIRSMDPETGQERVDVVEHQSPAPHPAAGQGAATVDDDSRAPVQPTSNETEN